MSEIPFTGVETNCVSNEDSKVFQERIGLFLRCSPGIPAPIPTKCDKCEDYHIIAKDLVYCVVCHHPKR